MNDLDADWEDPESSGSAASAADPSLPSLKKDNCIVNGRYRSVFTAQENIRLYIARCGEDKIGALTVTAKDCLQAKEFQDKWHSFLNALKKVFPTGIWTRERQPHSGNWHAHAAVDVGWNIQIGFPRDQVARKFYANVDPRLRALWKELRKAANSRGFGRIELLPLKYPGAACAKYFTKYLTKAVGSQKMPGEERCRLFGVWGGVRFVYPGFTFLSSRIIQKRKRFFAELLEYETEAELKLLSPHWWFHFGEALQDVIMPEDYYKVGPAGARYFDLLGLREWQSNWGYSTQPDEEAMMRSQFNLLYDVGWYLFRDRSQASEFAWRRLTKREPYVMLSPEKEPDDQGDLFR